MERAKPTPKKAKRIMLFVTQADWGGVQSFLIRFADGLIRDSRDVLLVAGGEGELFKEAEDHHIPTIKLKHLVREINLLKDYQAVREIIKLIDDYRPDAIHLNSSKIGVVGSLAAKFSKTKPWTVYRIGGWAFREPLKPYKKWLYQMAEKLTAGLKDVLILVHPGDAEIASKLSIRPRHWATTVPNGLDVPNFISKLFTKEEARQKLCLPIHNFIFGTVANAYATKGLLQYLDVLNRLAKEDRDFLAVIIGDGPEFNELIKKRDDLKLNERVILTGHRDDASRLYPAFDAFVLPSRKEGMPWTILEAMASGIPTVTTDVGACRWMLTGFESGDSGLIVPPDDPLSLIEAMRRIRTRHEERQNFSRAAHESVNRRFSWLETFRGNADALDKMKS